MQRYKNLLIIILAFFAGTFTTLATGLVFAHGGDTSLIHGCIRNNGLLAGFIRIVSASTNCANNETALDWSKEAGNNGLPFMCPGCVFNQTGNDLGNRLQGKNLTNAFLPGAILTETNLSGTNFTNANLTNARFGVTNLSNANFTGANLKQIQADNTNFLNANLTNSDFTEANLANAINLNTATLTGVIWSNTTCPDNTNSDSHGNTCVGHLTP